MRGMSGMPMSSNRAMRVSEPDEWEIREDAMSLVRAQEVMNDQTRLALAQSKAKEMAKESADRVNAMAVVGGVNMVDVQNNVAYKYNNPARV